jgi:NAD+ synthase (glutamine-hydrolysing)
LASEVHVAGQRAPFGVDLLFDVSGEPGATLAAEICEDLWVPVPPSSYHAVAGATLLLNLSASNDVVGKADYRQRLLEVQSARTLSAYVYAGCGVHESTTDVVFSGHLMIAELGSLLAEGRRFRRDDALLVSDVDVERLLVERARQNSFGDTAHQIQRSYRRVALDPVPADPGRPLARSVDPHPFVPKDPVTRDRRCEEVFQIQTAGLARRLEHTGLRRVVLGVSGGLDSTLAFLVCARTFDLLSLPRSGILAVSLPGPGTSTLTRGNAHCLAEAFGAELREIDIRPACEQHIRDIGLDPADTRSATYQNLQARERTQVLMDLANMENGLVVGTGDLSELALGFCTYAGDHMAMYNVNGTVPKTLVRHLVSWVAAHHATGPARAVLDSIVATPVSPELLPPRPDGGVSQLTEHLIGPYELHDFFLWAMLRLGAGPRKILFLARHAFAECYDEASIRSWLRVFVTRFFSQQFKRSALPDGPKVGSVSLSPRGDWRMPSDASAEAWLRELEP